MKKRLLFLFVFSCIGLSSCMTTTKISHLAGNYTVTTSIETNKSFDEVWDKVIDFFAISGIPISTLEKASGLIVSEKVSLKNNVTMEKDERLLDDKAFVVIPYTKNVVYINATSDFNVRVKKQNGKVSISVNLPNIFAEVTVKPKGFQLVSLPQKVEAKSTGVFENGLLDLFK